MKLNVEKIKLKKVQSALDKSFGIRCPVGVQMDDTNSVYLDDFENSCQWSPMPFNYTAFCGKCSQIYTYDLFRPNNISVSLTNNYVGRHSYTLRFIISSTNLC